MYVYVCMYVCTYVCMYVCNQGDKAKRQREEDKDNHEKELISVSSEYATAQALLKAELARYIRTHAYIYTHIYVYMIIIRSCRIIHTCNAFCRLAQY